tara:strand:- start:1031 stop:1603 length:573 start_codon:yes stop_codon:yes gene_type:complete
MIEPTKSASSIGQAAAAGAGGGAILGALATLFSENPSLKKAVRNTLVGATGGAAIGTGVRALGEMEGDLTPEAPALARVTAPAYTPSAALDDPRQGMSLPLAALSGLLPGVGPAAHGLVSEGPLQGLASGAASVAGPTALYLPQLNKSWKAALNGVLRPLPKNIHRYSTLLAILGATGAAAAGNYLREKD